jgi:2'-5' RNA ligase
MPRLFTGIEIPPELRLRLSLLRSPLNGAKWVEPDDMHITLRFLGDVDGRTADDFVDAIAGLDEEPFQLRISGLGSFGHRQPRALWAGVEAPPVLNRIQAAHERAARIAGLDPEARNFVPHVTLARLRGTRPEAVARFLEEQAGFAGAEFRVARTVVFSARASSGGGPYVVEEAFPLGSGGEATDDDEFMTTS